MELSLFLLLTFLIFFISFEFFLTTNLLFFPHTQWDTAGQERFQTIITAYYQGAQGIILVYSVTNQESFEHICLWAVEVKEHGTSDVKTILVGNKIDLHDQ